MHRFTLNREPQQFEKICFLVDGSHWQSKKKLKKTDERQKGHLGCSAGMAVLGYFFQAYDWSVDKYFIIVHGTNTPTPAGYNFNIYKKYVSNSFDGAKNSQSREQMHVVLDKLGPSLRQKNYFNFCRYVNTFFAIRNMIVMDML